jgi:hypothetical protein
MDPSRIQTRLASDAFIGDRVRSWPDRIGKGSQYADETCDGEQIKTATQRQQRLLGLRVRLQAVHSDVLSRLEEVFAYFSG